MKNIIEKVRKFKDTKEMKDKLDEMGVDYKSQGAITHDQIKKLLVKALVRNFSERSLLISIILHEYYAKIYS